MNTLVLFWGVVLYVFYEGRVVLDATFSSWLACSIKCACLWLLLCPGADRRCGRCHLSPCLLLCHMETLWSSPREVQLAAAGPRCSLLSTEAGAGGVHISSLSGIWLLWVTNHGLAKMVLFRKSLSPPWPLASCSLAALELPVGMWRSLGRHCGVVQCCCFAVCFKKSLFYKAGKNNTKQPFLKAAGRFLQGRDFWLLSQNCWSKYNSFPCNTVQAQIW